MDQRPIEGTAITNTTLIDAKNGVREHQTVIFQKDDVSKRFQFTSSLEHRLFYKRRCKTITSSLTTMYIVFNDDVHRLQ